MADESVLTFLRQNNLESGRKRLDLVRGCKLKKRGWPYDSSRTRASHLRLGQMLEEHGKTNEALVTYLKIIARYPHSEERQAAEQGLLRLAETCAGTTQVQRAMSVYHRLEGVF